MGQKKAKSTFSFSESEMRFLMVVLIGPPVLGQLIQFMPFPLLLLRHVEKGRLVDY